MVVLTPIVETAGDKNPLGVRCPDGEIGSLDSFADEPVRAEFVVNARMRALVEQIQIFIGKQAEAIARLPRLAVRGQITGAFLVHTLANHDTLTTPPSKVERYRRQESIPRCSDYPAE
jgi:hypothetical protein